MLLHRRNGWASTSPPSERHGLLGFYRQKNGKDQLNSAVDAQSTGACLDFRVNSPTKSLLTILLQKRLTLLPLCSSEVYSMFIRKTIALTFFTVLCASAFAQTLQPTVWATKPDIPGFEKMVNDRLAAAQSAIDQVTS